MRLRDLLVTFLKKVILSFILTIIIYYLFDNHINIDITFNGEKIELKNVFIICFFIIFVYVLVETLYFLLKNKIYKIKYNYYRELPRDYSPSMVSVLMNLKLEYKKDILSDLIFLEERKIIKIDNNQNIIIISKDNNWKNYENHLCLLLQKIEMLNNPTINNLLDNIDLMFQSQYKNLIINGLRDLGLIEDYTSKGLLKKVIIVFIFAIILLYFSLFLFSNSFMEALILILAFMGPLFGVLLLFFYLVNKLLAIYNKIIGKDFMRSKKGKDDVSLWISYDKFIRHFSIMEYKSLEEKSLWGYYFAYALALGINKKVTKKFGLEYEKYIIK